MGRLDRSRATEILARCGVPVGAQFHALRASTVESLIAEADAYGYRAPRVRNGSCGRYWHDYLQRVAGRYSESGFKPRATPAAKACRRAARKA